MSGPRWRQVADALAAALVTAPDTVPGSATALLAYRRACELEAPKASPGREAANRFTADFVRATPEPAPEWNGLTAEVNQSGMMIYTALNPAYKPVEHPDGSIWMEAEFAGMKIHWPSNRYATNAGGYVYG